jgi:dethiobiotin synthetase
MKVVIAGIGTDVGKTVVSAIVSQALQAAYWKPVQAGDLSWTDSMKVQQYCNEQVEILPEAFLLNQAMSPHAAAEIDGVELKLQDFVIPEISKNLVIEGAGGLCVPLNSKGLLYADVLAHWNLPIILVSRHYLGSINHTLLTVETLKNRSIPILGIIYVGDENKATEKIINLVTQVTCIGRVPMAKELNIEFIQEQSNLLKKGLSLLLEGVTPLK